MTGEVGGLGRNRIGALSGGWIASETIRLMEPTGACNVIFTSEHLAAPMTPEAYAVEQGRALAGEYSAYRERSFEPAGVFGGRDGWRRVYSWHPPDGVEVTQIQEYWVGGSRAYIATATVPTAHWDLYRDELSERLADLSIDGEVGEESPVTERTRTSRGELLVWESASPQVQNLEIEELLLGDIGGGGFGVLFEAWGDGGPMVAKAARETGGSHLGTFIGEVVLRQLVFDRRERGLRTLGVAETDQVLEAEYRLLETDGGRIFPEVFGFGRRQVASGAFTSNFYVMERLSGKGVEKPEHVAGILEGLADAVEAETIDYHGDLKPEHVFIGPSQRIRLIDPAPRLSDSDLVAFTPEFNPHRFSGPKADVYCAAVMLYLMLAGVNPHGVTLSDRTPSLEQPPTPVGRGRDVPAAMAAFIDGLLASPFVGADDWMYSHRQAAQRLRHALI